MRIRHLGYIGALAAFSVSGAMAAGRCQLQQLGVLPVDMQGLRPLVSAKINGAEARFILDSGSFYSSISAGAAEHYHLALESVANDNLYVVGVGGSESAKEAIVGKFEFLGMPLHNIPFLVFGQAAGDDIAGLIGQNVLRISDVEYDLSNGVVRFMRPVGCSNQPLAYWAVKTPYSFVELRPMDAEDPHLRTEVTINGHRMSAWFDTGASRSMLSLDAAKRAGITPDTAGVTFLGIGGGIGPAPARMWVAPVDSFQIGGEKVGHTHLLVADFEPENPDGFVSRQFPDMVLGDDFFLSHRIYVAYGQKKLYFTYNGGPLFNLDLPQSGAGTATAALPPGATAQTGPATAGQPSSDSPTDAAGFRRRGMAYASMREFDRALADLTRACELAPQDAQNRYQRGVIYAQTGRTESALRDFAAAITAQPDDIDAHLARAELLQSHPDAGPGSAAAEVRSDLDAVSRLATPDANVRLRLSGLYRRLGDYPAALDQVDQWLTHHPLQSDQAAGLNTRCWLRATANRDLQEALRDCNGALAYRPRAEARTGTFIGRDLAPEDPAVLDSRGLVYLRLGRPKAAVSDYNAALDTNPNMPTALYGRGLAELRLGRGAQAQKDLAAAEELDDTIAKRFTRMGLTP